MFDVTSRVFDVRLQVVETFISLLFHFFLRDVIVAKELLTPSVHTGTLVEDADRYETCRERRLCTCIRQVFGSFFRPIRGPTSVLLECVFRPCIGDVKACPRRLLVVVCVGGRGFPLVGSRGSRLRGKVASVAVFLEREFSRVG